MQELNKLETQTTNGGHKGRAYSAGEAAAELTLSILGFFASIAVGIDQSIK